MSSPPTQADIQAMADQIDAGLNEIEAQLTALAGGVAYEVQSAQLAVCAPIVNSVEETSSQLKGAAQGLVDQVQQLVAAVGQMADQTAANVATNMGDAGLPSPISAVTSDLVQDYSACAAPATADATSTTTPCPPVEVHVTCEPCTSDSTTTPQPTNGTTPPDTGPPLPPPTEPPPPEPPPPVAEAVCATWQQCPPDDLSWLGYQADPYLALLSPDPAELEAAITAYVGSANDLLGNATTLDDVFDAVMSLAPDFDSDLAMATQLNQEINKRGS